MLQGFMLDSENDVNSSSTISTILRGLETYYDSKWIRHVRRLVASREHAKKYSALAVFTYVIRELEAFHCNEAFSRIRINAERAAFQIEHPNSLYWTLRAIEAYENVPDFSHIKKVLESVHSDEVNNVTITMDLILREFETRYGNPWFGNLRKVLERFPNVELSDAMGVQQIMSKKWAIENIFSSFGSDLGLVYILGGWYGTFAAMMLESKKFVNLTIRSFDIDPLCAPIADTMNRSWLMQDWKFKATTADMHELNYDYSNYKTLRYDGSECELNECPQLVINLCCEHIENFRGWIEKIPKELPLVLQSNNFYSAPDHCNCVRSLEEFATKAGLNKILFAGELPLNDYHRFMLIGNR